MKIKKIELLLDNGADIDIQDAFQETPLHNAASVIDVTIFRYLLDRGANPNIPNEFGETPAYMIQEKLELYREDGYFIPELESLAEYLKEKGVKFPVEKIKKTETKPETGSSQPQVQVNHLPKQEHSPKTWSIFPDENDGVL
jgi:hypothetical protein